MNNRNEKKPVSKIPSIIWGLALLGWTCLVYVLFTINFLADYMNASGGR